MVVPFVVKAEGDNPGGSARLLELRIDSELRVLYPRRGTRAREKNTLRWYHFGRV